jgi:hypothetical protein
MTTYFVPCASRNAFTLLSGMSGLLTGRADFGIRGFSFDQNETMLPAFLPTRKMPGTAW